MKFNLLILSALFAILIISCDSGLKFENPNDPNNQDQSASDGTKPPKPLIHVLFEHPIQYPMSYRANLDKVQMNLKSTCVSDPDNPEKCLDDWEDKYYIKYKWEMTESPTSASEESQLKLTESGDAITGEWLPDVETEDNPKEAFFTPLITTPVRYEDENPSFNEEKCSSECGKEPDDDPRNSDKYFFKKLSDYFLCRQKYCEKKVTKYYKINIQAETVDKKTKVSSETAEVNVVPRIVPYSRVIVQLTWKQGFNSKAESEYEEGTLVDLDLHFIKKTSIEAQRYGFKYKEGLMGTAMKKDDFSCFIDNDPMCERYYRHDDCSFMDNGHDSYNTETIAWHASLDIDNSWGGGNYNFPETIGLGPIDDNTNDGIPDIDVLDDQYLVVVNYSNCSSNYSDGYDRCAPDYTKEDSAYEVDARVDIIVDGESAPRDGTPDNYDETTKNFKIKPYEWKVIAVVKWDNALQGPESMQKYRGNAIVTDKAMLRFGIETDPVNYPVCTFDTADANIIPIWNVYSYYEHITSVNYDTGSTIGICDKKPVIDECPDDPDKTDPGVCGCGNPDIDSDGDKIMDCIDNCLDVKNTDQEDIDGDGIGDACDNCPDYNNPFQVDDNDNGIGDVCEDFDDDGLKNYEDNCPYVSNQDQLDSDLDGLGDACDNCPEDPDKTEPGVCGCGIYDTDSDGDGIMDCIDNCPYVSNQDQLDSDSDSIGDTCDNCPEDPDKTEPGVCGCGIYDTDSDDDGFMDCIDNCPYVSNPDQDFSVCDTYPDTGDTIVDTDTDTDTDTDADTDPDPYVDNDWGDSDPADTDVE